MVPREQRHGLSASACAIGRKVGARHEDNGQPNVIPPARLISPGMKGDQKVLKKTMETAKTSP
jgi:hypothetical protein